MCTLPKPYSREFRQDVVRVARSREPGTVEALRWHTAIRQAAILAAYLAQFDISDTKSSNQDIGATALTERDREQYRRDFHRAADWVNAAEISDDDIAALARMRRRHGFPNR